MRADAQWKSGTFYPVISTESEKSQHQPRESSPAGRNDTAGRRSLCKWFLRKREIVKSGPPHIVHVIASSGLYGAEKWIFALMRAMDTSRFSSTLVNLSDTPETQSAVVAAAKERKLNALDFYTGGAFNPLSILRFSRWLKHNNVHIVHGHGYKSDIIGLIAARLAGCKIMSTPHGWSKEADKKLMFYEVLDRFTFRFMDYVCPLSEDLLKSVRKYISSEKLKLILNGVDIDEVATQPRMKNSSEGLFHIGYIGQLIQRKNIPILIQAVKILTEKNVNVQLVIVGDGPEKNKLAALAQDLNVKNRVDFLGYRNDAISILKSMDVFVLPSLLEGIPRCIMEAMAAEVPVVASDIPGTRELVRHNQTGLLYPQTDATKLADSLITLHANPVLRGTLAECAYKLVMDSYSNHRMAAEYNSTYSILLTY
ncbi:MAG: glycosyltransferase [Desulfobulbus sp.]